MLQQNKLSVAQKTSLMKNIEKEKEADRKIKEGSNIKNKWPQNPSHKKTRAIALFLRWLAVVYKINLEGIQSLHKEGRLSFLPGPECSLLPEKRLC